MYFLPAEGTMTVLRFGMPEITGQASKSLLAITDADVFHMGIKTLGHTIAIARQIRILAEDERDLKRVTSKPVMEKIAQASSIDKEDRWVALSNAPDEYKTMLEGRFAMIPGTESGKGYWRHVDHKNVRIDFRPQADPASRQGRFAVFLRNTAVVMADPGPYLHPAPPASPWYLVSTGCEVPWMTVVLCEAEEDTVQYRFPDHSCPNSYEEKIAVREEFLAYARKLAGEHQCNISDKHLRILIEEGSLIVTVTGPLSPIAGISSLSLIEPMQVGGCEASMTKIPKKALLLAREKAAATMPSTDEVDLLDETSFAGLIMDLASDATSSAHIEEAAEKAAAEKARLELEAAEKAAAEKARLEKEAAEKAAAETAMLQKEAAEKAAEKARLEKETAEKAAAEKARLEKEAAEKAAAEKAMLQKEAAEKAAEKARLEKETAEKASPPLGPDWITVSGAPDEFQDVNGIYRFGGLDNGWVQEAKPNAKIMIFTAENGLRKFDAYCGAEPIMSTGFGPSQGHVPPSVGWSPAGRGCWDAPFFRVEHSRGLPSSVMSGNTYAISGGAYVNQMRQAAQQQPAQQQETGPLEAAMPPGKATDWSIGQVGDYMAALGLSKYSDKLREQGVDGPTLAGLSEDDLICEIGMTKITARKVKVLLPK